MGYKPVLREPTTIDDAKRCLDLARRLDRAADESRAFMWLSQTAWCQGNFGAMLRLALESLNVRTPGGQEAIKASSSTLLGIAAMREGHLEEAQSELQRALASHKECDFPRGIIWTLQCIADLSHDLGNFQQSAKNIRKVSNVACHLGTPGDSSTMSPGCFD